MKHTSLHGWNYMKTDVCLYNAKLWLRYRYLVT